MDLNPGEVVIFEGRPSWRSILGFYILGALAAAAVVAIAVLAGASGIGAGAGAAVFAIVLVWGYLKRFHTRYAITNRRLYIRRGILSRSVEETRLGRVQDVRVNQRMGQRLLGIGTVDFGTSAESGAGFRFEGIDNPDDVARQVDRVVHEADAPAPAVAPSPPPPPPPA